MKRIVKFQTKNHIDHFESYAISSSGIPVNEAHSPGKIYFQVLHLVAKGTFDPFYILVRKLDLKASPKELTVVI